jgi:Delta7-sterol 5-desaturase
MFETHTKKCIFSVPFPGAGWIERLAAKGGMSLTLDDGTTYSSAYDAILNGDPLANPCRNFNAWVNSFFFSHNFVSTLIMTMGVEWAHYILCYLRNFIGAMVVYYGTAGVFHYFCYVHPQSKEIFKERTRPSNEIMWHQIKLSQASMTLYVLLPVVDEWLVEQGYTKSYHTIAEIGGWPSHIFHFVVYFALVELGIYWMHRKLHTNKTLYKYIHLKHHQYNTPETLTPWASIAFHPLDGILQASPYVAVMLIWPVHYLTHFMLLFFTAIWATYIHDAMDFNIDPIMGSKYHTVHHTHYIYNYGQVFIVCDWLFGTLKVPQGPTGTNGKRQSNNKKVD